MKKLVIKILITCLIIGGVGTGGYFIYQKVRGTKATTSAPAYITMTASKRNIEVSIQGTGTVFAGTSKDITAPTSGTVSGINVKAGDSVKKDSTLFTVSNDQLQENVTQSQNNVTKQQLQVKNAQDQLNKADTDEKKASAQDQLTLANLSLKEAKDKLSSDIKVRDGATVKAAADGLIIAKNCENGDNVQSGKSLFTIIDPNSLKVKVSVDELDIQKVQSGQKAKLTFGSLPGKSFDGTVEYISPTGNTSNNVTSYDVTVAIQNPEGIKLGMNATVNITTASKENALVIPYEALIERSGKKYVMVPSSGQAMGQLPSNNEGNSNQGQNPSPGQNGGQGGGQGTGNRTGRNGAQGGRSGGFGGNFNASGRMGQAENNGNAQRAAALPSVNGRLIEIKTGLEDQNYVEVLEGVTEGEKLIVQLPQVNSSTESNMMRSQSGGFSRAMGGGQSIGGGQRGGRN